MTLGMEQRPTAAWLAATYALMLGCSGEIQEPGLMSNDPGAMPDEPTPLAQGSPLARAFSAPPHSAAVSAGIVPLRRLTRSQLDRSISDLFGIEVELSPILAEDERPTAFISNVSAITELITEQHAEVARRAAAIAPLSQLVPCDASGGLECARQFISDFGRRAHRRPLSDIELDEYAKVFSVGNAQAGFEAGIRLVIQTMLQSPHFLYHVELGGPPTAEGLVPLTSFELASRLSYFLTGTMADRDLDTAAELGLTADDVASHARRLLESGASSPQISAFHLQWLGADRIATLQRDAELFPQFDAAMALEMRQEVGWFAEGVLRSETASFSELFTSAVAYPSSALFDVYQIASPAGFTPGTPVGLDPNERAGLLTLPALLATSSHAHMTSPVRRGTLVRTHLLCLEVPPPPPDVVPELPVPGEGDLPANATVREIVAAHRDNPSCSGCHSLIDPIGLGLEAYDAIGRYRTEEQGAPVDSSGAINNAPGIEGPFNGARQLAERLATSDLAQDCYSSQWFNFALGRSPMAAEGPSVAAVQAAFSDSGFNVRQMILDIVMSDAFRTLPTSL